LEADHGMAARESEVGCRECDGNLPQAAGGRHDTAELGEDVRRVQQGTILQPLEGYPGLAGGAVQTIGGATGLSHGEDSSEMQSGCGVGRDGSAEATGS